MARWTLRRVSALRDGVMDLLRQMRFDNHHDKRFDNQFHSEEFFCAFALLMAAVVVAFAFKPTPMT